MAELTTVARPYAKAAFQFADEQGTQSAWSEMLLLAASAVENDLFANYLSNPKLTTTQLADAFITVCADKLTQEGKNFITLLAQNKRLNVLPEISALFEEFKSIKERSVDVVITSAFALTEAQSSKLADALKRKLDREVNVSSTEDKSLIGGVIIRAGDLVIDGSVRGKLAKLAETLNS